MKRCTVDGCEKPTKARGLCGRHYQRWWNHGDPTAIHTNRGVPAEKRFAAKTMESPGGCILWAATKNPRGYGMFTAEDGRQMSAHRWAYEHFVGPVPEGMALDHTCHNVDSSCPGGTSCIHRSCVNPAHLEPVSCRENQRRSPFDPAARTHCPQGHPYDETNTYWEPGRRHRHCRACSAAARERYVRRKRTTAS